MKDTAGRASPGGRKGRWGAIFPLPGVRGGFSRPPGAAARGEPSRRHAPRGLPAGMGFLGLAAMLAWCAGETGAQPPAADKGKAPAKAASVAPPPLDVLPATRLTGEGTYDNQPAVAVAADGTPWVAWVRYRDRGADEVVACAVKDGAPAKIVTLSPSTGQFVRPVLAAAGNDLWCLWTASFPDRVSSIWFSRWSGGAWSPAARLLPEEARAHQNPELAAAPDSRLAVVYQVHNGGDYDIHLRLHDGKDWLPPCALSDASTSDWDPAAAFDVKGNLHVAWSGFAEGDYDIYWMRMGPISAPEAGSGRRGVDAGPEAGGATQDAGTVQPPASTAQHPDQPPGPASNSRTTRRLSARGEYDLHPWLAAAPDGTVWVSWDVVVIARHGRSGGTTITGANRKDGATAGHDIGRRTLLKSAIEVRVLDGDAVRIPGQPREEIAAPPNYLIAHCGLGKIAIGLKGEPWIFYRALHRVPSDRSVPYNWEVLARPFRDGRWQAASRLQESDGYLEEPGLASALGGILVAYGGEHRGAPLPPKEEAAQQGAPPDHHRDFDSRLGWKGDVYLGTIGTADVPGPRAADLPEAPPPADGPVPERLPRDAGRHEARAGATTYRLLWGDTHRHTNVSRCSQGAEPSADDHYKYGADICRYDFLALSDHAEDPRKTAWNYEGDDSKLIRLEVIDYYWWKQQKLTDLYHVPGAFSVLYNFEWTLFYPHGHHNTIFPSRPTVRLDKFLTDSSTLAGGWGVLASKNLKAITIPHTGADSWMGTAWEVQDDRYQRLCEIFQACRGSYEHEGCPRQFPETKNKQGFYWNALEKGYHVGIIASTDHGYGASYACVYAPENTREAIWQAMWDRRTYGSTTYGLVLEVRSGDHWMGEEWASKEAPKLDIYVRGAAPIRSVEILGRSKVLHAEGSVEKPLNAAEHRLSWTDPGWAAQTQEQWYYVRVIQTDDEIAWSSPVWVKPQK